MLKRNTARAVLLAFVGIGLAACGTQRPGGDPVVSPQLNSGITSSNGGGTRTLGNTPNIGLGGGPSGRSLNSQGASY